MTKNDEFGILLVGDIARQVLAKTDPVNASMSTRLWSSRRCVHPNMDIRYCSRLFARFGLVRALVVENKQVLGTISPNSLVLDGMYDLEEE